MSSRQALFLPLLSKQEVSSLLVLNVQDELNPCAGKQEGGARLDDKADHPRQFAASVQVCPRVHRFEAE